MEGKNPQNTSTKKSAKYFIIISVIVAIVAGISFTAYSKYHNRSIRLLSWVVCEQAAEQKLNIKYHSWNYPRYDPQSMEAVMELGNSRYRVFSEVTAPNASGLLMVKVFDCTARAIGDGVKIEKFKIH